MSSNQQLPPSQQPLSISGGTNMAVIQRPPSFPILTYSPRSHYISTMDHSYPISHSQSPISRANGGYGYSRHSTGLPPIQTSPPLSPQRTKDAMKISQLLSSPVTTKSPSLNAVQRPTCYSPTTSYESSPLHARPSFLPPMYHRNEPPRAPENLSRMIPGGSIDALCSRQVTSARYDVTGVADRSQHSPAMTSVSSAPSWYREQRETSFEALPTETKQLDYHLTVRQQPAAARACGFGERDRRAIDPPPTIELKISNRVTGAPDEDGNSILALHCTLLSADGMTDETELLPQHPHVPSTRRLMGTLVASPYPAKDENGNPGIFFVFPDMSCRSPGQYRLRFQLLRIDPACMTIGSVSPAVATITTNIFHVYTAKDFPGMRPSSALLKALRRQGLNVGVKKGSEARRGKHAVKKEGNEEEDYEEGTREEDSPYEGRDLQPTPLRSPELGVGLAGSSDRGYTAHPTTEIRGAKRRRRED